MVMRLCTVTVYVDMGTREWWRRGYMRDKWWIGVADYPAMAFFLCMFT